MCRKSSDDFYIQVRHGLTTLQFKLCILWNSSWGQFHKTFFFVIYGHFAINYGILAIYEQIYGQNLAVTTNPQFTDP